MSFNRFGIFVEEIKNLALFYRENHKSLKDGDQKIQTRLLKDLVRFLDRYFKLQSDGITHSWSKQIELKENSLILYEFIGSNRETRTLEFKNTTELTEPILKMVSFTLGIDDDEICYWTNLKKEEVSELRDLFVAIADKLIIKNKENNLKEIKSFSNKKRNITLSEWHSDISKTFEKIPKDELDKRFLSVFNYNGIFYSIAIAQASKEYGNDFRKSLIIDKSLQYLKNKDYSIKDRYLDGIGF